MATCPRASSPANPSDRLSPLTSRASRATRMTWRWKSAPTPSWGRISTTTAHNSGAAHGYRRQVVSTVAMSDHPFPYGAEQATGTEQQDEEQHREHHQVGVLRPEVAVGERRDEADDEPADQPAGQGAEAAHGQGDEAQQGQRRPQRRHGVGLRADERPQRAGHRPGDAEGAEGERPDVDPAQAGRLA